MKLDIDIARGGRPHCNILYVLKYKKPKVFIFHLFHLFAQNDKYHKYNKTMSSIMWAGQQGAKTNTNSCSLDQQLLH